MQGYPTQQWAKGLWQPMSNKCDFPECSWTNLGVKDKFGLLISVSDLSSLITVQCLSSQAKYFQNIGCNTNCEGRNFTRDTTEQSAVDNTSLKDNRSKNSTLLKRKLALTHSLKVTFITKPKATSGLYLGSVLSAESWNLTVRKATFCFYSWQLSPSFAWLSKQQNSWEINSKKSSRTTH